ncbi:MAG: branched-chain amino acid aminotransferase, partial [Nitrospirae bacterium]|nr:branched-chain amino acid aminotransferase [Nitrospirota bacterium]
MRIYLNGELLSREKARVSVFDRGFLYGDGVFETLRAYGGAIFRRRKHVERLIHSAEA